MRAMEQAKRRWGDNDRHLGPLTFAYRESWRPFAFILTSGDGDERDGCCLRLQAFGATLICELPPIIKPWRRWVDLRGKEWAHGEGYWDQHAREYGFTLSDGHLYIPLGAQTHDSTTTQSWSCFLPWTQWRQIAHRIYNADGSLAGDVARQPWDIHRTVTDAASKVRFAIEDFDSQEIIATTYIEEREWRLGEGWFRWLGYIAPKKRRRSLSISFDKETGPEKGSWKGGTTGTGIEMQPGEMHEAAMRRYCEEDHRSKYRRYSVKFLHSVPFLFTEENCPGHVASAGDKKVCGNCGVHIDSLRPDDEL